MMLLLAVDFAATPLFAYIITTDGTDYYCTNGFRIIYGGPRDANGVDGGDPVAVIQAAVNSFPFRNTRLKIMIKCDFTVSATPFTIPDHTTLEVHGRITMGDSANTAIFQNSDPSTGNSDIMLDLADALIEGNGERQSSYGNGALFIRVSEFTIFGGRFQNCRDSAITLLACRNGTVEAPYVDVGLLASSGGIGLAYGTCYVTVIKPAVFNATTIGINISGGAGRSHHNHVVSPFVDVSASRGGIGIGIDGESEDNIIDDAIVWGNSAADAINCEGWGAINKSPKRNIINNAVVYGSRIADAGISEMYACEGNQFNDFIVYSSASQGLFVSNTVGTRATGKVLAPSADGVHMEYHSRAMVDVDVESPEELFSEPEFRSVLVSFFPVL
jgi:hypothetical protein